MKDKEKRPSKKNSKKENKKHPYKKGRKEGIRLLGTFMLFVMFLLMLNLVSTAYQNPSKTVLVSIDDYNEANIEMFIIMPLIYILGSISLIINVQEYFKK